MFHVYPFNPFFIMPSRYVISKLDKMVYLLFTIPVYGLTYGTKWLTFSNRNPLELVQGQVVESIYISNEFF